jgi:cell wall-associated NlpC family hydrolase
MFRGECIVAIAASPTVSTLPSTDLSSAFAGLQQAVSALSAVIAQLQAQSGTGALAGAATLGGGAPGSPTQSGCGCGGGTGAAGGVEQFGPPPKGAEGAPPAPGKDQESKSDPKGAKGAPKADKADAAGGGDSSTDGKLVAEAKKHLGAKYVYGAEGPDTFDCSGLTQFVAKQLGINLPRTASQQATAGKAVDKADLQPGDLVYFSDGGSVSHVGMFVGDGKYIHAPKPGDVVKISSLNDSWAKSHYSGGRRIT